MSITRCSTFVVLCSYLCLVKGIDITDLHALTANGLYVAALRNGSLHTQQEFNWKYFTKVAYDNRNRVRFLYDSYNKVIYRSDSKDPDRLEDVVIAVGHMRGMAVDTIETQIYWTDRQTKTIERANYDGSNLQTFLQLEAEPEELAIDSEERLVFWIDGSDVAKSSLNGFCRSAVLSPDGIKAGHILLDPETKTLFIYNGVTIYSFSYTGVFLSEFDVILPAFKMAVASRRLIFGYIKDGCLCISTRTHRGFMSTCSCYPYKITDLYDLLPVHNKLDNHTYTELCQPPEKAYIRDGFDTSHQASQGMFSAYESFLLVADQRGRSLYKVNPITMLKYKIPVTGLDQPYGVAYDAIMDQIYWTDIGDQHNSISRANIDGTFQEIVFHRENLYSTDIKIDSQSRLAFFVDFSFHRIGVLHLDSLTYRYLSSERGQLYHPFSLFLSHERLEMFISTHRVEPSIIKYSFDRNNYEIVTDEVSISRGLVNQYNNLFWIESTENVVKVHNKIRNTTEIFLEGNRIDAEFRDVEFHWMKDFIFVTDSRGGRLIRLRFNPLESDSVQYDSLTSLRMYLPGGMSFVKPIIPDRKIDCFNCTGVCFGLNMCMDGFKKFEGKFSMKLGFCRVNFEFDEKTGKIWARHRAIVHNGIVLPVTCNAGYKLNLSQLPTCTDGVWENIPSCVRETSNTRFLYGNYSIGWQVLRTDGRFQIRPEMTSLSVIVIGAGGGGYNESLKLTGDGTYSEFLFLRSEGGHGGMAIEGGQGGRGRLYNGDHGDDFQNGCSTGGRCQGHEFLCGDRNVCKANCKESTKRLKRLVLKFGFNVTADCKISYGLFGRGGAGHKGGSGGGGGFSCGHVPLDTFPPDHVVNVTVGKRGNPSHEPPRDGVVIVTWGMGDACKMSENDFNKVL